MADCIAQPTWIQVVIKFLLIVLHTVSPWTHTIIKSQGNKILWKKVLKSFRLADIGQDDLDYGLYYWRKMTQIRDCSFVLFRYSGVVRELPPPHLLKKKPRLENLRKMSFGFGMTTGWYCWLWKERIIIFWRISMSTEVDEAALEHLHVVQTAINLRELSVKLSKYGT